MAAQSGAERNGFDPRGILAGLARNHVSFVLIGGLARVIRGTNEVTDGVDVCPSLTDFNLQRANTSLPSASWTSASVVSTGLTNNIRYATVSLTSGNRFFRLYIP